MKIKIVLLSILAMAFLYLSYAVDWLFIIGAVLIVFYNQKEILKSKNNN